MQNVSINVLLYCVYIKLLFHTYFGFVEQTNPGEGGTKEVHDFLSESYVQVLFPGGLTTAKFDVHLVHDVILEHNETFRISIDPLSLPHGVILGTVSSATVTILDDDSK